MQIPTLEITALYYKPMKSFRFNLYHNYQYGREHLSAISRNTTCPFKLTKAFKYPCTVLFITYLNDTSIRNTSRSHLFIEC